MRLARLDPTVVLNEELLRRAAEKDVPVIASVVQGRPSRFDSHEPRWAQFVSDEVMNWCLNKGFTGCVLDASPTLATEDLAAVLAAIRARHPKMPLYVSAASGVLASLPAEVGWYLEIPESAVESLKPLPSHADLPTLVVVTSEDTRPSIHRSLAEKVSALGGRAFVTPPGLPGISLAPLREVQRKVLVLYGWDPAEAEKPMICETDSMVGELLQTPLELLGYEAEYLDIGSRELPLHPASRYAAVFLDGELSIPGEKQPAVARWLAEMKNGGRPVFFLSGLPFTHDEALSVLRETFGLQGSLEVVPRAYDPELVTVDEGFMNFEAKVAARSSGFTDLRAPESARVLIRLRGKDSEGRYIIYDPAFLCDWGGLWFDPHLILRGSQDSSLFFGDPYAILTEVMNRKGPIPAPDVTTRYGQRIFYSHIDGDGFGSLSDFRGHPFCAELVRDRILKKFPLPITVSIVQADMEALAIGIKDEWKDQMVALARSIFELPNVSAASHSFAHPYQWDSTDSNPGIYTEPFMTLKPEVPYQAVDLSREIQGSIRYINDNLLPPGKQVELMLWSGNCRPGREALRMVRELGIENMNGGNTIVSRLYPGIAGVAPRVMPWGDELQIYAANQNEFMYANGWNGPFFGGFADVIDTFERTETPRRLKPVNVYYHFYSATSLSSLRALEKIHHWCMEQPLHPVTAQTYARIVRDAHQSRIFEIGPRHWELRTGGHVRTFRLPSSLGQPDLEASEGILGWVPHADSILISTDGRPAVRLKMQNPVAAAANSKPEPHLRLLSATAQLEFDELSAWKTTFKVDEKAMKTATVVFSGLPEASRCDLTIDNTPSTVSADTQGRLSLSLRPGATVTIDAQRARFALLR